MTPKRSKFSLVRRNDEAASSGGWRPGRRPRNEAEWRAAAAAVDPRDLDLCEVTRIADGLVEAGVDEDDPILERMLPTLTRDEMLQRRRELRRQANRSRLESDREYSLALQRLAGVTTANFSEIGPDGKARIPSELLCANMEKAVVYPDELADPSNLVRMGEGIVQSSTGFDFCRGRPRLGGVDWCWGVYARPDAVEAALRDFARGRSPSAVASDPAFATAVVERAREIELAIVAVALRPVPLDAALPCLEKRLGAEMRRVPSLVGRGVEAPELDELSEFVSSFRPLDTETHKLTQDELDDLAEEMGYASNSDDDDDEMHEKRAALCEEDRLRARAERRARRHAANLADDRTPLHLPGEPTDEETRRLRLMYQAAGLPVRGSVEVLPDASPHIERRWGEDCLRKGTQVVIGTQETGGLVTKVVLPGTLAQRRGYPIHLVESRRLRSAIFRLFVGPNPVDRVGKLSALLGLATNACGQRLEPEGIATVTPLADHLPPPTRSITDVSPGSFYFASDVPNSPWRMLLGNVGRHATGRRA